MIIDFRLTGALVLALAMVSKVAAAQPLAAPQREIPLYAGAAPGSEEWDWEEQDGTSSFGAPLVQNVVRPVLQYYPANKSKAVGAAVIVVPGGGGRVLMMGYEGADIARRLSAEGVDAFVLKYRLSYTPPATSANSAPRASSAYDVRRLSAADGQQAVRIVRQRALEFGVRPDRIGMMGFSFGGSVVLAAVLGPVDSRPDFAAPIYTFIGDAVAPPDKAPPLFIAVAADDTVVGSQASLNLFSAWRKARVPVELHIFQIGQHGFLKKGGGADHFMDRFVEWMQVNGWLTKAAG